MTQARVNALCMSLRAYAVEEDAQLGPDEILGILHEMGIDAQLRDAQEVVRRMDLDGDGLVSKTEVHADAKTEVHAGTENEVRAAAAQVHLPAGRGRPILRS